MMKDYSRMMLFAAATLGAFAMFAQSAEPLTEREVIWDVSRIEDGDDWRIEFPDLIRFRGSWFCAFREGKIHGNHPSGRGRVIRSADGKSWESVMLFEWAGGDVRDPRFSITADGSLMINTSIFFVSSEPRPNGNFYQLDHAGTPESDDEAEVARQSVTWLSRDGVTWSAAHACPTGVNTWRWDVTWHNGMGYSVAYSGKDRPGALYRTRDGRNWRLLRDSFFPESGGSEAALAFPEDNLAVCLLRQPAVNGQVVHAVIGIGRGPSWQSWEWKELRVDWGDGEIQSSNEGAPAPFAGPKLIQLSDGRLVATGRNLGLWLVDPEKARVTKFAESLGPSYPGLAEHEGKLWVTSGSSDTKAVLLATFEVPK